MVLSGFSLDRGIPLFDRKKNLNLLFALALLILRKVVLKLMNEISILLKFTN
jgi:hypothetical protein